MTGRVWAILSAGSPKTYFGTIHAPERVERKTLFCHDFCDSSETKSAAEFPIPTTTIRLPFRSSGSVGSM